jgi:thiamine biosynthesis protein ThiS
MIIAKGRPLEWNKNLTVQDVLQQLGFGDRLVYIRVNGERISRQQWDTYRIQDEATVDVMPVVLGG